MKHGRFHFFLTLFLPAVLFVNLLIFLLLHLYKIDSLQSFRLATVKYNPNNPNNPNQVNFDWFLSFFMSNHNSSSNNHNNHNPNPNHINYNRWIAGFEEAELVRRMFFYSFAILTSYW
jgi:hypothetical protein